MDESVTTPEGPVERWLPVVGYESYYEVSDFGRVKSLSRRTSNGQQRQGRILSQALTSFGHPMVSLCVDGAAKSYAIHQLVAKAFIGPYPDGMEVCHGANGRLDNRLSNLSYGTKRKNQGPDKVRDGTTNRGDQSACAILTEDIVRECRKRAAAGERCKDLAEVFGVARLTMWSALTGKNWFIVDTPTIPVLDRRGENHTLAKLTWEQVREIRRRGAAGEIHRTIAADFGISRRTAGKIISGTRWAESQTASK